jgi:hypothetical protein
MIKLTTHSEVYWAPLFYEGSSDLVSDGDDIDSDDEDDDLSPAEVVNGKGSKIQNTSRVATKIRKTMNGTSSNR